MNKKDFITNLRKDLIAAADPAFKESMQHYFKEPLTCYGLRNPHISAISKTYFNELKKESKVVIFDLCEDLFASGYFEESIIAAQWSEKMGKYTEPHDFVLFERWINKYIHNWATCDTLCNHTVGDVIMKFPELLPKVISWTTSSNRWVKRAAAVSLIVPAKKGLFLPEIKHIATALLIDKDDMVQKGYGWLLKAASQAHEQDIFDFVMSHKHHMPRTALRYAIEKMAPELRQKAMAKD